jgi:antitoxin component of RelBE/YafQ-DinJ toxin-antitoxin module
MLANEKKKLTIRVDARLIEQAKAYAEENNTSISQLVEVYLLTLPQAKTSTHTPLTQQLTGIIPRDIDVEKAYHNYLMEKYGEYNANSG